MPRGQGEDWNGVGVRAGAQRAAILELQARSRHEIDHRARDADIAGAGRFRDARADLDNRSRIAGEVALTDMDARPGRHTRLQRQGDERRAALPRVRARRTRRRDVGALGQRVRASQPNSRSNAPANQLAVELAAGPRLLSGRSTPTRGQARTHGRSAAYGLRNRSTSVSIAS